MFQNVAGRCRQDVQNACWSGPSAVLVLLCLLSCPVIAFGVQDQDFTEAQLQHFENKVRPILVEHCYECHGPEASPIEGGLLVSSRKSLIHGGDTGPAITPGQAAESLLIESIRYEGDYEMPPDTRMSDEKIETLTNWINDGAPWPNDKDHEHIVKKQFDLDARKKAHWAWKPFFAKRPPKVGANWPADPIDQFIFHELANKKLTPAKPADRRTLIRRAYFDFIGIPPTPEQVDAFVNDKSENAFEKVVDELLANPQFGERWARHWMDLVRYAETYGHEFDYEIPFPHQYRDYLIRAFNEDVSYKQIIEEHIAGDLLPKPRRHKSLDYNESVLGTGFWHFHEAKHGAVDSRGEEAATFDNQIDVMTKTFLGMTVACARCHDHKFDAISAADYYALYGYLKSSRRERVMLDPERKIEKARQRAERALEKSDQLADRLIDELKTQHDRKQIASYLNAALEATPGYLQARASFTIQGESLKSIEADSGTVETQRIAKRQGFAWQGDQQLWWRDGKIGDVWSVEFEIPKGNIEKKQEFQVVLTLTVAADYGNAELFLGDQEKPAVSVDCYAEALGTKTVTIPSLMLKPGTNQLKIRIKKPNKKAIARNMIGIDAIQFKRSNATEASTVAEIAKNRGLDKSTLTRLVEQVASKQATQRSHPLFQIRSIVDRGKSAKEWTRDDDSALLQQNQTLLARQRQFLEASKLFVDFAQGLPQFWTHSGFAFDQPSKTNQSSLAEKLILPAGTISSGRFGKPFYGLLRSPSFTIENEKIHYRVRGRNVTVRLIIDSFFMDEYNALLYRDCKKVIPDSERFTWLTQSGDIKNYIGRRAYLEVIDHGNGFVELEQIRFSNAGDPAPVGVEPFLERSSGAGVASTVDRFIELMQEKESAKHRFAASEFANWLLDHKLISMVASSDVNRLGKAETLDTQFVSQVHRSTIRSTAQTLRSVVNENRARIKDVPAPMMALGMADGHGEDENLFVRGNHNVLGEVVPRRFLSAISKQPLNPKDSSGRLKLARKITAPNNPLTSRVAVNRLWHHMMGRGIVESVDNFGVLGKAPSHPELLDYLATEFKSGAWSVKRMLKRIALTKTYQMSSQQNPDAVEIDPDNVLLHRANIKRLQGESIRDSLLAISGRLDTTMYGPSVPIHLTSFMTGRGRPRKSGPLDGNGRRSLYLAVRRNFLSPMMLAFDTPAPFNAMGKRNQSNVPSQALIMMNSPLVIQQAKIWAEKLIKSEPDSRLRIERAFQMAYSRPPTAAEVESSMMFLKHQLNEAGVAVDQLPKHVEVWTDFCHVLFNAKEFIYIQ